MKISLLSPTLSSNCLGRAYVLAKVLERRYMVEIVGPVDCSGIWEPLRQESFACRSIPNREGIRNSLHILPALFEAATGDVIYASKPLLTSFGVGLLRKIKSKVPLVVDIDDWELGAYSQLPFTERLRAAFRFSAQRMDAYYPSIRFMHQCLPYADAKTVSSSFLQQQYGGIILPHGRDTSRFDPCRYNPETIKKQLGITARIILFLGTPRPRKGLEDLLEAVRKLNRTDIRLLIVGANPNSAFTEELARQGKPFIQLLSEQPFSQIPDFLSAADIVAIPQRADPFSRAQVPAKIFDAMAMARPIISTEVSDIPQILSDGCGISVPPGDVQKLAGAIEWCLENEAEAGQMGIRAREKCIRMYSWDAMEQVLARIFAPYE